MTAVAAVVLAAGASSRMGRAKALIRWRGLPWVEHCVAQAAAAGCDPIVVVEGAHVVPVDAVQRATVVRNPDWRRGQLSSLQAGLAGLQTRYVSVLVLTVDRPHVRGETVTRLVDHARQHPDLVVQPKHAGRRGHPIVYPHDLAAELATLPPDATPRELLDRPEVTARRTTVAVDDPAVLDNLDTPQAAEPYTDD